MWSYTPAEIHDLLLVMFDNLGLLEEFSIPVQTFLNFTHAIEQSYLLNPYHHFLHAVDVTQMCYLFLTKPKLNRLLSKLDMFCLLLAAICHDVCHPGTSQH